MGNKQQKDCCFICHTSFFDIEKNKKYCVECNDVVNIIKSHPRDVCANTQMIMDRGIYMEEIVTNTAMIKCYKCNKISTNIVYSGVCIICEVKNRLKQISENIDVVLRYDPNKTKISLKHVKTNGGSIPYIGLY